MKFFKKNFFFTSLFFATHIENKIFDTIKKKPKKKLNIKLYGKVLSYIGCNYYLYYIYHYLITLMYFNKNKHFLENQKNYKGFN